MGMYTTKRRTTGFSGCGSVYIHTTVLNMSILLQQAANEEAFVMGILYHASGSASNIFCRFLSESQLLFMKIFTADIEGVLKISDGFRKGNMFSEIEDLCLSKRIVQL